jgi:aminoglycoside 2''-phosphotransferase
MDKHLDFIRKAKPDLYIHDIRILTSGWDNDLYVINGHLAFRFPKNRAVAKGVATEIRLLKSLRERGKPALKVPDYHPWYDGNEELICVSYEFIAGTPFNAALEDRTEENARKLGAFLSQLHRLKPPKGLVSKKKADWEAFYSDIRREILPHLTPVDRKAVQTVFARFLGKLDEEGQTLLHGDLTASNIISSGGQITGIIDFTDAHIGDPAFDFAGIYWDCGPEFTEQVLRFYSRERPRELFRRVQQFYGLQPVFHELLYSVQLGQPVDWEHALDKFHEFYK